MYDYTKNLFPCVDWIRGIVELHDVVEFTKKLEKIDSRLSLDNFVLHGCGMLNYSKRFNHITVPSLTFAFNPIDPDDDDCMTAMIEDYSVSNKNPFILISLSGDAIRFVGSETLQKLIKLLSEHRFYCTRLDLAADIYDSENPLVPLLQEAFSNFMCPQPGDVTVKAQLKRDPNNFKEIVNTDPKTGAKSINYTLGNHGSSHGMLRLYDKRLESLYGRNRKIGAEMVGDRDYWWRLELELHNGSHRAWAQAAFYNLASNMPLFCLYGHCLKDYITIVQKKYAGSSHTDLDVVIIAWNEFIDELVKSIHFV